MIGRLLPRLVMACTALFTVGLALGEPRKSEVTYTLPADVESFRLPPGPGMDLVVGNCSGCHSLDYIRTQPRGKGAQFWKDEVHKMVTIYTAPVLAEDADRIAEYLGATFGQ